MAVDAHCDRGHLLAPDGSCDVCEYLSSKASTKAATALVDEAERPTEPTFARTDAGNAELFTHLYSTRLRYDHRRRHWLEWAGHWWRQDIDSRVVVMAKDAARHRYERAAFVDDLREREAEARWAIASENRFRLEAAMKLATAEKPIADAGNEWDCDPWLLGVANGVVDLKSGRLRVGKPNDRITIHSDVAFDPDATCPRWERFIQEIFDGDDDLVDWLRRAMGYSLTGDTSEQCHFICWGRGANGKTTLQRVQREVMGEYAGNTPFSTLEMSSRYAIPNDLAALYGKRVVGASELNEAVRLNEARLKMLAGEDPITARFLHGEFFTFTPVAKFWLSVNHKPIVNDDSTGFWRKIRLIPFTQSFEGRADPTLKVALREEYPGILNWIVRGCLEWQEKGLAPPDIVLAATAEYKAESDPLATFIQERCAIAPNATIKASDLYKEYQEWAISAGLKERERLSNTKFGRLMSAKFEKRSTSSGNTYGGIGLKADADFEEGVEGFIPDNPPFSGFSLGDSYIEKNRKNHPQPSSLSEAIPANPPQINRRTLNDPPRCIDCNRAMSAVRVSDVCGLCKAKAGKESATDGS